MIFEKLVLIARAFLFANHTICMHVKNTTWLMERTPKFNKGVIIMKKVYFYGTKKADNTIVFEGEKNDKKCTIVEIELPEVDEDKSKKD